MKTRRKTERLIVESPDGKVTRARLPTRIAFAAARGIALATHCNVRLEGPHGVATFDGRGGGTARWATGEVSHFDASTTVRL